MAESTEKNVGGAAAAAAGGEGGRGTRRTLVGRVVSDKMQKTVVVLVTRRVKEPRYGKIITQRQKYAAHDEKDEMKVGDRVEIVEHRPISRTKRWKVVR